MTKRSRKKLDVRKHLENPHPYLRLAFIAVGGLMLLAGIGILWAAFTPIPDLNSFDSRKVAQSTKIYDREGKTVLYDLNHDVRRNVVPLTEISPNLQKAAIAIEDSEFYNHSGVSFTAIARAIWVDITTLSLAQGGSTITQQVVKNTILSGNKTAIRKIQEWILAWKLEQKYTKDQILEFYFNVTPYGGTLYGAEVAARAFFGKSANDLSLAEAAYLAAIPQRPTFFSPYGNNRARLDERKDYVLERMEHLGYITEEEMRAAQAETVVFSRQQNNSIIAPHFVFYIEQLLEDTYGPDVVTQGLSVITTLDVDLQNAAQSIVKERALENTARFNASNAALVAIDPKTGQILAMVGSRDYFDEVIPGNYNVAVAPRQPGSAFKPFVYAAAIEKGYTPETVIFDVPTQFSTACSPSDVSNSTAPCYAPQNYDLTFRGPMTFRTALAQSINIPAVKALYLAGIDNVIDLSRRMGISTLGEAKDYGLSFALGAAEVSPLEMASAMGVFANDGVRNPPTGILEIRDMRGRVIEKFTPNPVQAISPEVARQMADIMSDNQARVPSYNINNPLAFSDYDVAAKTGTTNESRDAWTVGYSPTLAVAVWAGNNDNSPMVKEIAGYIVAPMWREFMDVALTKVPKEFFKEPPGIPESAPAVLRGQVSWHSLLLLTNKENPQGPPPANPWSDPQLPYWETPIQAWAGSFQNPGTASTTPEGDLTNDQDQQEDTRDRDRRDRDRNQDEENN
ncbi:MAG TPA: PBP1A family penicillin-binding protein [Candidatus Paceibacterota bacterium]|nr:PBP1A family penicillin-binding protein [Candidatus Paceibacterota bacterium]